jgi:hypothetical protein
MNKNTQVILGIAAVVIIGGLIFYSMGNTTLPSPLPLGSGNSTSTPTTPVVSNQNNTVTKSADTFKSLFNQPGSHVCTYEQVSPTSRTTSIVYIADGKMRGEFRTSTANKGTGSMMVYNGGTLYVWAEGSNFGTKSQLKSVSELPFVIPEDLTSGKVLGGGLNSVSWDCHAWLKDNTLLVPPTAVKFQ